ncbi:MAG: heat-inducible transcriptional repressor HrcA [Dehalococcoidales bacterium]|nr:heat-inducible transcriptional repressor HrcA [Dehalococcoidales bacterium]
MLSARTGTILKQLVEQYIDKAVPVPSMSLARKSVLRLSPATIRNEMACLEQEGYIFRPHTSAGSIPSDKGYRYYVESLRDVTLSPAEQRLISHLFHKVEREIDGWLSLAATLMAQLAQNVAIVSLPRPVASKFKHIELVALQGSLVLTVVVLSGVKVKEKLITFDGAIAQSELSRMANKLNAAYSGISRKQLLAKEVELSDIEKLIRNHLAKMMQAEDDQEYEETLLDGLHFILNQPEFARSDQMKPLMELVEYRKLLKCIVPKGLMEYGTQVVIGKENRDEAIHNYSVVISHYGLPDEATGTIGVVGPTRMHYARTISTVNYISLVLSELMAGLYGRKIPAREKGSSN